MTDGAFFDREVIAPIAETVVNAVLLKETFVESRTQLLQDQICKTTMSELSQLAMPMKWLVSCVIVQNNGAGWSNEVITYCDRKNDGHLIYSWPTKKMKEATTCHMNCVVTVAGFVI